MTWYASTIVHDASHSELCQEHLAEHGSPVPDDVYIGLDAERYCLIIQLEAAGLIGAPQSDIDYIASLTGDYADVDGDGDFDLDDYLARDW